MPNFLGETQNSNGMRKMVRGLHPIEDGTARRPDEPYLTDTRLEDQGTPVAVMRRESLDAEIARRTGPSHERDLFREGVLYRSRDWVLTADNPEGALAHVRPKLTTDEHMTNTLPAIGQRTHAFMRKGKWVNPDGTVTDRPAEPVSLREYVITVEHPDRPDCPAYTSTDVRRTTPETIAHLIELHEGWGNTITVRGATRRDRTQSTAVTTAVTPESRTTSTALRHYWPNTGNPNDSAVCGARRTFEGDRLTDEELRNLDKCPHCARIVRD